MNTGYSNNISIPNINGLLDLNASTIETSTLYVNGVDMGSAVSQIPINTTNISTNTTNISTNTTNISSLQQLTTGISYNTTGDLTTIDNNVKINGTLTMTPAIATQTYVDNTISALVGAAPAALNTLVELASALSGDAAFSTTVATSLAGKASLTATQSITGLNTFTNNNVFQKDIILSAGLTVGNGGLGGGYTNMISNCAFGQTALSRIMSQDNIGIGAYALTTHNGANGQNVGVGTMALYSSLGTQNTSVGYYSLSDLNTANGNTAIGYYSGKYSQGTNNTFLGANTDLTPNASTYTNSTAIGYNAKATGNNSIQLGTSSETVYCQNMTVAGNLIINGTVSLPPNVMYTDTVQTITGNKTFTGNVVIDDGLGHNTSITQNDNNFNIINNTAVISFNGLIPTLGLNYVVCTDGSNPIITAGQVISGINIASPLVVSSYTASNILCSVPALSTTIIYAVGSSLNYGMYMTGNPTYFALGTYIVAINAPTRTLTLNQPTINSVLNSSLSVSFGLITLITSSSATVANNTICASYGGHIFSGKVIAGALNYLTITSASPLLSCRVGDRILGTVPAYSNLLIQNIKYFNNVSCSFNTTNSTLQCATLLDIGSVFISSVVANICPVGTYITGFTFPSTFSLSQVPNFAGTYLVTFATFILNQSIAVYTASTAAYNTGEINFMIPDYTTGLTNNIISASSNTVNINGTLSATTITATTITPTSIICNSIKSATGAHANGTSIQLLTTTIASGTVYAYSPALSIGVWLVSGSFNWVDVGNILEYLGNWSQPTGGTTCPTNVNTPMGYLLAPSGSAPHSLALNSFVFNVTNATNGLSVSLTYTGGTFSSSTFSGFCLKIA